MNKPFRKYTLVPLGIAALIIIFVPGGEPVMQASKFLINQESQVTGQSSETPGNPRFSDLNPNPQSILHLSGEDFQFEAWVEISIPAQANSASYKDVIRHDQNGALDLTLISQGNTTKYLLQISHWPQQLCTPDDLRACQQGAAAPARGNVSEIQFTLPNQPLKPGTYFLGKAGSTPETEVISYGRQLYSDPSHGQLGCQRWGEAILQVRDVTYTINGMLAYLEADFSRTCDQTTPFPPAHPYDPLPEQTVDRLDHYHFHASWRCQLTP